MNRCRAIQYSDEMACAPCGLRWDTNDDDPPRCALPVTTAVPITHGALSQQVGARHYKGLAIQPIEFAMRNRWDNAAFSTLKYLSRWRAAKGMQDLLKSRHFVQIRRELDEFVYPLTRARYSMRQYVDANGFTGADANALYALDDLVIHGGDDRYETALGAIDVLISQAGQVGIAA